MTDESSSNIAEFTVSEISGALKRVVEDAFGHVRVRGEISGYRGPHSSGHCYFSLKDERSRIEAVIWKGVFGRLRFPPEEGMEVIATGKLTTFPGSSKYQIVIEALEPAGAGALMALLEERKRKLAAEGLFDPANKQLLPYMPRVIGVVTSPTGAVIRDIIHRITDRFPLHVIVWPVRVQGEASGAEVANAIAGFNALPETGAIARPDLIIVARGGGSLEDLWGFNDEAVARAAANSLIPLISAVGHETDWTLIDLAADIRAPTPTGAAEMAVPVKAELEATLASLHARLRGAISRQFDQRRNALRGAARALPSADQLLALPRRRFDEASANLGRMARASMERKRVRFERAADRLQPRALSAWLGAARDALRLASHRIGAALSVHVQRRRARMETMAARLNPAMLAQKSADGRRRLDRDAARLEPAFLRILAERRRRLDQGFRMIRSLSYEATLERGFALVRDEDGRPLTRAAMVKSGQTLAIQFADGTAQAQASGAVAPRPAKPKPAAPPKRGQGELF